MNSAPSRVWQELQGPWDWWIDGTGVVASDDGSRLLGVSSMFSGNVRLQPFDSLMRFEGNVSGVIQGQMTLAVRPHCCIPWRSVVHVSIKGKELRKKNTHTHTFSNCCISFFSFHQESEILGY